jgi:cytochrome c554/c'-like protein
MRPLARRAACLAVLLLAVAPVRAQEYLGPTKCFGCHKLGRKVWQDGHAQTLAQLSEPKAAEYAKATGGDAKHPKCLACHAPVMLAAGPAPVSCETCHGPGKGWLVPHQELAFYSLPTAQWQGLRNLYLNSKEIARICVECHVLNDKAIAAAGHPVGAAFDAGRDMAGPKMVHWPSGSVNDTRVRSYDKAFYAAMSREGAPMVASRSAGVGGGKPAALAGARAGAPPAKGGGMATVAPQTNVAAKPAVSDDEYADLGDDEFTAPPVAAPVKPRPIERVALPDAPAGAFDKAPVRIAPRPAPPPPPPPPAVPAPTAAATPPPTPPPAALPAKPRGPAEVRGRAALVLADLIRQKKKLDLPKPAPPAEFAGPDGELLRLQDEVLALALETLRRAP